MQGQGQGGLDSGVRGGLLAAGWLAGVALQVQLPALWPPAWLAGALAVAALLAAAGWRWRQRAGGWLLLCAALGSLAFCATSLRAGWQLEDALAPALEGQDLVVTGVVAKLPRTGASGTRFVFDVEGATRQGQPVQVPERLSLGWYQGFDGEALPGGPPADLRAGQRWRLAVRLRQPHGSFNPHGFDLELWLWEQGIRAGGSVRGAAAATNQKLAEGVGRPVERARQWVRDAIYRQVLNASAAGVLAALVIGDQAAIDRDDWDLFRTTGVAHLMSISGLHVTMFAWLAGLAVGWLWRRSAWLMLACATPTAARWGGLALAAGYALLAGWGVPAQRTVWMLAVVALLSTLGLRWPLPLVLLAAAVVVTALDPWALLQPGFWLSFMAVGLLVVSEPAGRQAPSNAANPTGATSAGNATEAADAGASTWWQRLRAGALGGLRTQAVATIGLAPLSMLFFQQVSIVGFLANLVAIPLVTLLITPLGMLGVAVPASWSLGAALVQGLNAVLQALAAIPGAVWTAAAPPLWAAACGLLAATLAVLPLPWRLRLCSLPLMLPLLLPAVPRPAPGQFELVVADVGQGTAVLLRTANHLLVYDAGPSYSPESDAGGRVLLPLLRARGERAVDLLMLSHRDTDHVGGAASLMAGMPVRALSTSLRDDHPLLAGAGRGVPHRRCDAGQAWQWDGVQFEVLHPLPQDHATATKSNPLSCVLRAQGTGPSVLLTGDIEAAQEAALVQRAGAALASQVLLVPHHGSRTSSTAAFLDAVAPRVAVAQAAYRSRFGHPAPTVVERYQERGIRLLRSDRCGAWTLRADGSSRCERFAARRYWHHPDTAEPAPDIGP
jgi:competence protein ComEC